MSKNLIYGLVIGFGTYFLFEKVGKRKCSCTDVEPNKTEPNPPNADKKEEDMSCEEAVELIISERLKTARLNEAQIATMRKKELAVCKGMTERRR